MTVRVKAVPPAWVDEGFRPVMAGGPVDDPGAPPEGGDPGLEELIVKV